MAATFSLLVATIPDEWIEGWQPGWPVHEEIWPLRADNTRLQHYCRIWWVTWWLFEGELDQAGSSTSSWFSRNLVLLDAPLIGIDRDALAKRDRTLSLRNRDLRYAILWRSDLRKADLSYAHLQYAFLANAKLQGALLDNAEMQNASLASAQLQGAWLNHAKLQGASLDNAQMQGAFLIDAHLEGASLEKAHLETAYLETAHF